MNDMVTVTIPNPSVEKLSSRERSRGKKPAKGWLKHATGVNRSALGGYAILGSFIDPGERQLPVGSVVVESHWDKDCRVSVVAFDGSLVSLRNLETDGAQFWFDSAKQLMSLCNLIERALSIPQLELLQQARQGLEMRCLQSDATEAEHEGLVRARERLLAYKLTTADRVSREEQAAMHPVDAAHGLLAGDRAARLEVISQILSLMAEHNITIADLQEG